MTSNAANWSLVSWNVRGLGDADKCKIVRDTLLTAKLDVACLQESKLRSIPTHKCRSFLPPNLTDFHFAESVGSRGGIVTTWDSRSLTGSSTLLAATLLHPFSRPPCLMTALQSQTSTLPQTTETPSTSLMTYVTLLATSRGAGSLPVISI